MDYGDMMEVPSPNSHLLNQRDISNATQWAIR